MDTQNNGMEIMREIGMFQLEYESLVKQKKVTKKAICDLVIPFRERYHLTDKEALAIARNELRIDEIVSVLEDAYKKAPVVLPTQQDANKKYSITLPYKEVYAIMDRHPMTGTTYLMKRSIRSLTIREIEGIDKKGYFFSTVEKAMEECKKLGIHIADDDEHASYHRIISTNDDIEYECYAEMEFPTAYKESITTKQTRKR